MNNEILIIRSVSFQHLDMVLTQVRKTWPEGRIILLTHAHGREAALKTQGIDEVQIYPQRGDFSFWKLGGGLRRQRFDHLVVPFSNQTGVGFANVLAMAFRFKSGRRWTLPLNGSVQPLTWRWWLRFPILLLMKGLALVMTVIFSPFIILWLLFMLLINRKKKLKKNDFPCEF